MVGDAREKLPTWYWAAAILITLWGATGILAFYMDVAMSDAARAALPDYDRQLLAQRPRWVTWLYGLATWGGFFGGLALLARRRLATYFFALSLIAAIVQFAWVFGATDLIAVKGAAATVPFPIFIIAVAVVQLWLARTAAGRGWLR